MADWYAAVPQTDGLSFIEVYIEHDNGEYCWAYSVGEDDQEVDTLEDSGCRKDILDVFEDIAASLCEVGFNIYTDDVKKAFAAVGLSADPVVFV